MTETVFGVLALALAILYSLHHQQAIMAEYDDMIKDEYEIMASGVALEVMENVARHPFDASTADEDFVMATEFKIANLASHPFAYAYDYDGALYLEHFNNTQTEVAFQAGSSTVTFTAKVQVYYVNESGTAAGGKTDKKQIDVSVYHERYDTKIVELKRTISPVITSDDT